LLIMTGQARLKISLSKAGRKNLPLGMQGRMRGPI
jgi:hypothetical protein